MQVGAALKNAAKSHVLSSRHQVASASTHSQYVGYVGQKILHRIHMDRSSSGCTQRTWPAVAWTAVTMAVDQCVGLEVTLLPPFHVCQNFCVLVAAW